MAQRFKAVYYPDYQEVHPGSRSLTIAFNESDSDVFGLTRHMSSEQLRRLLGCDSYLHLAELAAADGASVNSLCLSRIRESLTDHPGDANPHLAVDPLQVTFRGGSAEPGHGWYSYLEGYSPQFVRQIIEEYAPGAHTIYDPFGGVGTTPTTGSELGLRAFYSELNPFLRDLAETKIAARSASAEHRRELAEKLVTLACSMPAALTASALDASLRDAYSASFRESVFFDDVTMDLVLRARTLADHVAADDPLLGRLMVTAIANSLIPASLLQRAGDIRYKSVRELERRPSLVEAITSNLGTIAADLPLMRGLESAPRLLSGDAKEIGNAPAQQIDLVVTSPPYLNGTNYFRNTKVELWFTRHIETAQDLAQFRRLAVTAGINDVTRDKGRQYLTDSVARVVGDLEQGAYDKRIPRMVAQYFTDMAAVFGGLRKHLVPGAIIAIDIGDSIYAGTHVATDSLLVDALSPLGYQLNQDVTLRTRSSYNGAVLRQALLVFEYRPPVATRDRSRDRSASATAFWEQPWRAFKETLPHQVPPFSKRNWGSSLHSLCSYQGKMKPALAHQLVRAFVPPSGRVLDVFAGVGTIPFEAALDGATAYGFDISPAAIPIARAKVGLPNPREARSVLAELERYLTENEPTASEYRDAGNFGFNGRLDAFFEGRTLREVLLARSFFAQRPPEDPSTALVMASVLHVLHGNRPYALSRRSHPITPFAPTGEYEYRSLIASATDKVERSLAAERSAGFVAGTIFDQDATTTWPDSVQDLDAIITSPPFFDSTRFHMGNWMRLWFAGWSQDDFKTAPKAFVDELQKSSFAVYDSIFAQACDRLRPGGVFVLHLGRSRKCDMASVLAERASEYMEVADVFSESVEHCESHGIRDKGTVVDHQYLVLVNRDRSG